MGHKNLSTHSMQPTWSQFILTFTLFCCGAPSMAFLCALAAAQCVPWRSFNMLQPSRQAASRLSAFSALFLASSTVLCIGTVKQASSLGATSSQRMIQPGQGVKMIGMISTTSCSENIGPSRPTVSTLPATGIQKSTALKTRGRLCLT